jgi:hypothetical protein
VANEDLKKIYEQVFGEVRENPQIQGLEKGLLYNTILVILGEERLQTQNNTREICDQFDITSFASEDADFAVIAKMNEVFIDRIPFPEFISSNPLVKSAISSSSTRINQSLSNKDKKMEWIVLAACTLIGLYYSRKFLKNPEQQTISPLLGVERTKQSALPPSIPAALCLIVPASVVSSLERGSNLSVSTLTNIIDNASYFLCANIEDANSSEQNLEMLLDQKILSDSKRDVYIRINVNDGRKLIGNKIRYQLKENLQNHAKYIVAELACLKNLSGLEVFNRV